MPTVGHVAVTEVDVPGLIEGLGFEMVVDCGGVFGGCWMETFEGPAIEVGDCGEVEEGIEIDYS
jgi:hypothetical protein